jgi:hypothetical protein
LGNIGEYDVNGNLNPDYGLKNTGPFTNIQDNYATGDAYWTSTDFPLAPETNAFVFFFYSTDQSNSLKTDLKFAWAVRDGDVGAPVIEVSINIRPWSKRNPVAYNRHGVLPVAILSTDEFDASAEVDHRSLTFGATGNEKSLAFCNPRPRDVGRDHSKDDLVCYFYLDIAGFNCGDTEGILKGKTLDGTPIEGEDLVRIINCK